MALETELQTYTDKLPELREHQGKFVLIHGTEVVDIFDGYADALREGYRQFGVETPFLVKQIEQVETAQCITRLLEPDAVELV